jgi:ABC-2 type transport system ATP-binding protein
MIAPPPRDRDGEIALDAVRLTDVTKTFGKHTAVEDLSLAVPAGSIYGFIGPNGSGKTTTLRMILHVIHPDRGTIEVLGGKGTRASNDRIGYLPEERGLYKKMTVRTVLAYYGSLKGLPLRAARRAGDEWLERFELTDWAGKKIETLSKGMAQKVQFISTVLHGPELLVLDEPFSGLDPVNLEVIRGAILDLSRKGTTIIFSTHDMAMAERMCDFVFMIFRGRKVLDGTLESIQERWGADTVRLRLDGDAAWLDELPDVEGVIDMGRYQEVRTSGDPQALLASVSARARVDLFEVARPSLHDLFVRIAGPEAAAAEAAGGVGEADGAGEEAVA